jgi:hypothetical protein
VEQYSGLQQQYGSLNVQYGQVVARQEIQNILPYKQQLKRDVIGQLKAMGTASSEIAKDTIFNPKRANEPGLQNEECAGGR